MTSPGQCIAVASGKGGTGKTTTLSVLAGLNKAYRGKVVIDKSEPEKA